MPSGIRVSDGANPNFLPSPPRVETARPLPSPPSRPCLRSPARRAPPWCALCTSPAQGSASCRAQGPLHPMRLFMCLRCRADGRAGLAARRAGGRAGEELDGAAGGRAGRTGAENSPSSGAVFMARKVGATSCSKM